MENKVSDTISLIRKAAKNFNENDPIMLAGALAFFTVFAIPPILIMIIYCIGFFTGYNTANAEIFQQIENLLGPASANVLEDIVAHYFVADQNILQRIITSGIFLFASSSFFIIIQHALNKIWNVRPKSKKNLGKIIENRALSFGIIILMGIILTMSLGTHTVITHIKQNINELMPFLTPFLLTTIGIIVSFLLGTLSFGVIYKFLPDVIIKWKVVWVGAAITSVLFTLGKFIIGFGLRSSDVQAMYGTAGAMAIFLLWVFYSSIILFFGAKITQEYGNSYSETIQPKDHAVKVITKEVNSG